MLGGFKVVGWCVGVAMISACGSVPTDTNNDQLSGFDEPAALPSTDLGEELPQVEERQAWTRPRADFNGEWQVVPLSVVPPPPPPYYPPPENNGPVCRDTLCMDLYTEQDISYILIDVPCADAITSITVTDLVKDPGKILRTSISENEPSASGCSEILEGIKLQGINTSGVELCLETSGIDPDAVTVQVKDGLTCEVVVDGDETCECSEAD